MTATFVRLSQLSLGDSVTWTGTHTFSNAIIFAAGQTFNAVKLTVGSQATGDLLYASSASVWARLAAGTTGQILTISGGLPAWSSLPPQIVREIPTGLINSSNVTFTLSQTPATGSEQVFMNGILQESGAGNDYTISAAIITFSVAPITGAVIVVTYSSATSVLGFTNPMTTLGDVIFGNTAGVANRLPIGTTGQVLTVSGGLPVWSTPSSSGALLITNNLSDLGSIATAVSNLGLTIGTNTQAFSAVLTAYAAVGSSTATAAAQRSALSAAASGANTDITSVGGLTGRLQTAMGASVASANNLTLGADGNLFTISGTTQINLIDSTGWSAGSRVTLIFSGALTVKNNQTVSGSNKPIILNTNNDYTTTAGYTLDLIYNGTAWYDIRLGQQFSKNYILASSIAVPDLNLALSLAAHQALNAVSGAATDNTAAFNAVLAKATSSNPVCLIIDGCYAHKGIQYPDAGYVSIIGLPGSCLFLYQGSNAHCIRPASIQTNLQYNNAWNPGNIVQSTTGANISFKGLTIYGNRGTVVNGGGTSVTGTGNVNGTIDGTATGLLGAATPDGRGLYTNHYWFVGIWIQLMDNIVIEDCYFYDISTYSISTYNCTNGVTRNNRFFGAHVNQDGVHHNGGDSYWHDTGNTANVGDDSIAVNLMEGNGQVGTGFIISDLISNGSSTLGRVESGKNVSYMGCTGTVQFFGIVLGNGAAPVVPPIITNVLIADTEIQIASGSNLGFILLEGSTNKLTLDNVGLISPPAAQSFIQATLSGAYVVDDITFNVHVVRNSAGSSTVSLINNTASIFNSITINHFEINDYGSYSATPYLINMAGGMINNIWINSLNSNHVTAFCNDYTKIASGCIGGPGVATCGFQFPDSKVANNTPYYSSNQGGSLCVKVGGVPAIIGSTLVSGAFTGMSATVNNPTIPQNGAPLQCAFNASLQAGGTSFLLNCWVKTKTPHALTTLQMYMGQYDDAPTNATSSYVMFYANGANGGAGGFAGTVTNGTSTSEIDGATHPADNTSYMVSMFYDAIGTQLHIYVNGTSDASPISAVAPRNSTLNFSLGGAIHTTGTSAWDMDGKMSTAMKLSVGISAVPTLLTWLYNSGNGRNGPETLAYLVANSLPAPDGLWAMATQATIGTDSSANANNLTPMYTAIPTLSGGPADGW